MNKKWETVVGLEIHVQLNTKTKLFSRALNSFGGEPNTYITEICTGQPGSLPLLNKEAVKKAVQLGCAFGATVANRSKFDRKTYFYPDSPRNFQITQFDKPLVIGGLIKAVVNGVEREFQLDHAHLEDDAGTLKHFSNFAGVDYNRAGAPLVEIVSKPCFRSGAEAAAYASAVRTLLLFIDVSECNMEEGGLRFDANISVRPKGSDELRTKIEIKNMNSFANLEEAIGIETLRQISLYEEFEKTNGPDADHSHVIANGTYRYDPEKKEIILMRMKESADDYLYFPEPDLMPLLLSDEYIENIRKSLPELPYDRFKRYTQEFGLFVESAEVLISEKFISDFYDATVAAGADPKLACNWITVDFPGILNKQEKTLKTSGLTPKGIAALISLIQKGELSSTLAKKVALEMVSNPSLDPIAFVRGNPDYAVVTDRAAIEKVVDDILAKNHQTALDYLKGKDRALGALVGQVMGHFKGKAPADVVSELLITKINKLK